MNKNVNYQVERRLCQQKELINQAKRNERENMDLELVYQQKRAEKL